MFSTRGCSKLLRRRIVGLCSVVGLGFAVALCVAYVVSLQGSMSNCFTKKSTPKNSNVVNGAVTSYSRPRTKDTIAICAVTKYEDPYLDEWVDYNLGLGFAAIFLYDNTERFELEQWGLERKERGESVEIFHNPGLRAQTRAYEQCAQSCREEGHTWVFFGDNDEFLILKKHNNVADFAAEYIPSGHLGINWRLFGTSGRQNYQPIPVTKRFVYRVPDNYDKNTYIKSIVRLEDMDLTKPVFDPHFFHRRNGTFLKDTDGNTFNASLHKGPADVAAIYHYYFKSSEEYIRKRSRGAAYWGEVPSLVRDAIAGLAPNGKPIPNGTIFDDLAWRTLKRNVPKYAMYDEFSDGTLVFSPDTGTNGTVVNSAVI